MSISRRDFIQMAAAVGAACMWGGAAAVSRVHWRERRDLFPEGVASGDPDPNSVILWTRRPFAQDERHRLTVEVAEDPDFQRVIAHASARVFAESDWTSRVLVGGLPCQRLTSVTIQNTINCPGMRITPSQVKVIVLAG